MAGDCREAKYIHINCIHCIIVVLYCSLLILKYLATQNRWEVLENFSQSVEMWSVSDRSRAVVFYFLPLYLTINVYLCSFERNRFAQLGHSFSNKLIQCWFTRDWTAINFVRLKTPECFWTLKDCCCLLSCCMSESELWNFFYMYFKFLV